MAALIAVAGIVFSVAPSFAQVAPITLTPVKSTVFTMSQSADLWYFGGVGVNGYNTSITINTAGPSEGTFLWTCAANPCPIAFQNGLTSISLDGPAVDVVSTGISIDPNNQVGLNLSYNGNPVGTYPLTIFAPTSVGVPSIVDSTVTVGDVPSGFMSVAVFPILDDFGNQLTVPVYANETFDQPVIYDYPGSNWTTGQTGPSMTPDVFITDKWTQYALFGTGFTPSPLPPQTPLTSIQVFHIPQHYFVGSTSAGSGQEVETHTLQYYQDHARPE